jgi:hypothetical protein
MASNAPELMSVAAEIAVLLTANQAQEEAGDH